MKKRMIPLALSAIIALSAQSYAKSVELDIASQPLSSALSKLAEQSGMSLLVSQDVVAGKTAPALKGAMEPSAALAKLLAGTDLEASTKDGTITVRKAEGTSEQSLEKITLAGTQEAIVKPKEGSAEAGYKVDTVKNVGPWGERSLQDTPYSMTSQSAELIQNVEARDEYQLFMMNPLTTPGYSTTTMDGGAPTIRGFQASTFVDGNQVNLSSTSLVDKERVEIISGAQSFLNDSTSVGGSVNYVFKRPTTERLTEITVGNYGGSQYYAHADLGGMIDKEGKFGYRINVMTEKGDTNIDDQHSEKQLATIALDWHITNDLLLQPIYSYTYNRMDNPSAYWNGITDYSWVPDNDKTYGEPYSYYESAVKMYGSKLTWNATDWLTLRADYLRRDSKGVSDRVINYLNTDGSWNQFYYNYKPTPSNEDTGKIYLDAKFNTGSISHKTVIGYSIDHRTGYTNTKYGIARLYNLTGYVDQPSTYLYGTLSNSSIAELEYKNSEFQRNAFKIGDDISFNEQWSLLIGASHSNLVQKNFNSSGAITSDYDKSTWTPTVSLLYKPLPWITTYATYIEALENGTIVSGTYTNAGEVLDPTVSKQYEIGVKTDINDMLITAALFRLDKVNQYSDNATPIPTYVQDGRQIHQGLELTATGKATDNLTIMGGITLAHQRVEKSNNPAIEGNRPTLASTSGSQPTEQLYKLYAEYAIPGFTNLILTGGVYYAGNSAANAQNTAWVPSYTVADAGARYSTKIAGYDTTFRLNIQNVTDEEYWSSTSTVGNPRTVAFSANMKF
ncbi:MAG: TonB-dependent siderophore receptor [Sulfuricurvum sp.]|uniref:TonB-dependent siderophore receptor n=1 Tax=Sulfuricurvum sp. TaxID=2025608 RepID=UPI003D0E0C53